MANRIPDSSSAGKSIAGDSGGGLATAIATYLIWGFLPLYLKKLSFVPALELVGWRIIFTLPLCLIFIHARRQWGDLAAALANRRVLLNLCMSALLIGGNWLLYTNAINNGHVLAASLGYYICPLLNVLLGTVFLGERLNRVQWLAVGIAAMGIGLLLYGAADVFGVALSMAASFALYGLVRKLTPVGSVPGLTIETSLLILPAIGVCLWLARLPAGSSIAGGPAVVALLFGSGVLTAVPLLLFAVAARKLDLSVLGFIQFIAPTIVFVLGHFVFHEPLDAVRLTCFVLIWIAIALFSWDMLRRSGFSGSGQKAPV
nr:EamA family transporter RarD [Novosphingobium sp. Chol11]